MKIEITVPESRIADLMTSAVEGNPMTRAWCGGIYLLSDESRGGKFPWYAEAATYADPKLRIHVIELAEVGEEKDKDHYVQADDFTRAFVSMASDPVLARHLGDFLAENNDAVTSDVFLQVLALGEVIYG